MMVTSKKKPSVAQVAARKLFAVRSKAGTLTKSPKASRDYARDSEVERAEAGLRIARKRKTNPTSRKNAGEIKILFTASEIKKLGGPSKSGFHSFWPDGSVKSCSVFLDGSDETGWKDRVYETALSKMNGTYVLPKYKNNPVKPGAFTVSWQSSASGNRQSSGASTKAKAVKMAKDLYTEGARNIGVTKSTVGVGAVDINWRRTGYANNPVKSRAYKGKYPRRIKQVASMFNMKSQVMVLLNNGQEFIVKSSDTNGRMPRVGDDFKTLLPAGATDVDFDSPSRKTKPVKYKNTAKELRSDSRVGYSVHSPDHPAHHALAWYSNKKDAVEVATEAANRTGKTLAVSRVQIYFGPD